MEPLTTTTDPYTGCKLAIHAISHPENIEHDDETWTHTGDVLIELECICDCCEPGHYLEVHTGDLDAEYEFITIEELGLCDAPVSDSARTAFREFGDGHEDPRDAPPRFPWVSAAALAEGKIVHRNLK